MEPPARGGVPGVSLLLRPPPPLAGRRDLLPDAASHAEWLAAGCAWRCPNEAADLLSVLLRATNWLWLLSAVRRPAGGRGRLLRAAAASRSGRAPGARHARRRGRRRGRRHTRRACWRCCCYAPCAPRKRGCMHACLLRPARQRARLPGCCPWLPGWRRWLLRAPAARGGGWPSSAAAGAPAATAAAAGRIALVWCVVCVLAAAAPS